MRSRVPCSQRWGRARPLERKRLWVDHASVGPGGFRVDPVRRRKNVRGDRVSPAPCLTRGTRERLRGAAPQGSAGVRIARSPVAIYTAPLPWRAHESGPAEPRGLTRRRGRPPTGGTQGRPGHRLGQPRPSCGASTEGIGIASAITDEKIAVLLNRTLDHAANSVAELTHEKPKHRARRFVLMIGLVLAIVSGLWMVTSGRRTRPL